MKTSEIIEQTKRLIAIPSTADNPAALREAVEFVADMVSANAKGITIEHFESNGKPSFLAYAGPKRPARFDVILNAHIDVVPAPPEQYVPKQEGQKLYGRGAFDMKAAAVAETAAFCEFVHQTPYTLGLQIVSDEEIGGYDGAKYQLENGVRADFVITGEHTFAPNVIYTEQRGICWVELAFQGKTAHGGYPWRGQNALTRASAFAHAVLAHYPVPEAEIWGTTANIANIHTTNNAHNAVPDNAVLKIDFRFTPEDRVFHTLKNVRTFLHSLDPDAQIVSIPVFDPAMSVDPAHPTLRALVAALESTRQTEAVFDRRYAGGDARHYAALGDAAVEFGLTGGHMHGADEFVDIDAIDSYVQTLRTFLTTTSPVPAPRRKGELLAA